MTDARFGGFVRENLSNDDAFALRVGGFVRESLSHDVQPPTNLNVGGLTRESLSIDIHPPTELNVADLTRESLEAGIEPPIPPAILSMDDLLVTIRFKLDEHQVFLRNSNDAGASWGNAVGQSLGEIGEFDTSIQWRRTSMGRDRIFEIFWSSPVLTSLVGVFVDFNTESS